MGLLKVGLSAASSVLADQWREYFYCSALDADVLVKKGEQRQTSRGFNRKKSDNIISNGSIIAVNEGQCMIIVEQGAIVDVCAEAGEFVYDTSTEPSIFYGSLKESIKESFKTFGKRFAFGGDTAKDQRVYFFNTKEIMGNKYGTANPVPFRVVDTNVGLDIDIAIRCHGEYAYRLTDPILFYKNICGNVEGEYTRDKIDSQLKSEFLTALQPAFAKISDMGIRYSSLPGHADDLADAMNEVLSEKWSGRYGIEISTVGVNSVKAPEEDEKMIKELQRNAAFRNPNMAAAQLVGAQSAAMQAAAANTNAGPMMAFAGMNMAANAGGANIGNLFAMGQQAAAQPQPQPQQAAPVQQAPAAGGWNCACGATGNTGKFCAECGAKKPESSFWTCSCGAQNKGKFCPECGAKKPEGVPQYKCDKCGWEPEDPKNPPRFCPECGDPFDSADIK
ncbi:MAG: SPFH domain-containing protein [Lachnospiraceae bacterium]|nr:SPFH domain-containing protein [Lachnospiraceae bacterium]